MCAPYAAAPARQNAAETMPPPTAPEKKPPKKAANSKKPPKVGTEYENPVSTSLVTAFISFCLFLLFVLICVKPEGALLMVVKSVVLGLVGRAGFYFLIPALLILGVLCALLSYRLFRQKQGCPPSGPPENHSRELAAVFVLLSLAAAAECYAVPYLAKLVLSS